MVVLQITTVALNVVITHLLVQTPHSHLQILLQLFPLQILIQIVFPLLILLQTTQIQNILDTKNNRATDENVQSQKKKG